MKIKIEDVKKLKQNDRIEYFAKLNLINNNLYMGFILYLIIFAISIIFLVSYHWIMAIIFLLGGLFVIIKAEQKDKKLISELHEEYFNQDITPKKK